ncbi:MAG: tetratricopeptide repeat protein [Patescibacteria group bacterium]|nr:tetratricopeptide repeat protein [Patescibacteria group bacterium]
MLTPRKKITKKELKKDPLVTYTFLVQDFFARYQKNIIYWTIGVIAVIGLATIIYNSRKSSDAAAFTRVGQTEILYTRGQYKEATVQFLQIINEFPGTNAAGLATFYLANCYYYTSNLEEAKKYYQQYIDDYSSDPDMTSSSFAGLAACLENNKQYDEAIKQYTLAIQKNPEGYAIPQYYIDLARCYQLSGKIDDARSTYKQVIEKYSDSPFRERAEELMAQL